MTTYTLATLKNWTEKAKANAEYVVRGSIGDVAELATRRQASVKDTGGTFQEGFVPVDTGELIQSQILEIDGAPVAKGAIDFEAALAGFDMGQTALFGFTADHARRMEYGFTGTDSLGRTYNQAGRFFVRNAVQQWQSIVDANAAYIGED